MRGALAGLLAALSLTSAAEAQSSAPNLILNGRLTGEDHQTYREIPFRVPAGTTRLTLSFDYAGRDQKAVVDLGLRDPERFRGWSGGNKSEVVLEEADATPSYLPGPIPAGSWRLVLGVPNLRQGTEARWTARVWFSRTDDAFPGFVPRPVRSGEGWYRGDLHTHTGHSDGTCASRRGATAPCPVFKTLEAAEAAGLDFIAVSDHNATSQAEALRELAPYFDDLLLIPAREITTFQGHANVLGPTAFLDFQLGSPRLPDFRKLEAEAARAHGVISINHPGLPSGESCMGCGWRAQGLDLGGVQAVEVVNGGALRATGSAEGPLSGLPFWEARLNEGLRLTAIGGSDDHDPTLDPMRDKAGVGRPATVVHAAELSQAAVLEGVRRGHVFVDVEGVKDRRLTVTAEAGDRTAEMGDVLPAAAGARVVFSVEGEGLPDGAVLSLAGDGARLAELADRALTAPSGRRSFAVVSDGRAHWLRVDIRDAKGRLILIGNPIYLRPPP